MLNIILLLLIAFLLIAGGLVSVAAGRRSRVSFPPETFPSSALRDPYSDELQAKIRQLQENHPYFIALRDAPFAPKTRRAPGAPKTPRQPRSLPTAKSLRDFRPEPAFPPDLQAIVDAILSSLPPPSTPSLTPTPPSLLQPIVAQSNQIQISSHPRSLFLRTFSLLKPAVDRCLHLLSKTISLVRAIPRIFTFLPSRRPPPSDPPHCER